MAGGAPTRLLVAHTARVGPALLAATRAMLDVAFDGDLTADDWEHCLGGVHAIVLDGDEPVAHAAVTQRRLLHGGRALRTGYVEGVGVRPDRRGEGLGATVMEAVEDVCAAAYDIGALCATDMGLGFYAARGWQRWRGTCSTLTPDGLLPTLDAAECLFVLPCATRLDLTGAITSGPRPGDPW